ncbi:MAG: cytochrome c [Phycisphaerales bacterium]|nr:MAG: cytochrome c [Phycisphaerales bacterium]
MRKMSTVLMLGCLFVCGCPFMPPPGPPPAAVLEGTWSVIPEDPGEFEGWEYEAKFNSNGDLVELSGVRPEDGATARLTIDDATTELEGSDVVITLPDLTGARVFEGTLSDDQNTMTGSVTDQIDLGDLEASLPGGELTFERITNGDPCDDVTCEVGESCVDGECIPDDPCADVTCDPGTVCVDGECVPEDLCADVTCPTCETCVDGVCEPLQGDPVAGDAFYAANSCAACHGDNAEGAFGPSLIGTDCITNYNELSGIEEHTGGTVDGVTEQDAADLVAWYDSL